MLSVSECIDHLGLSSHEVLLGPGPSAKHEALLASYLLNRWRGAAAVYDMIRRDLKNAVDLGARERAADLFLVLRLYSADLPRMTCAELVRMTKTMKTRHRPQLKCLSFDGTGHPKFARKRLRRLNSY
jgi:hypothetical protein